MKTLLNYLEMAKAISPFYKAILQYDLIRVDAEKEELLYEPNPAAPPKIGCVIMSALQIGGISAGLELLTMAHLLCNGPKVFRFDSRACEALENFDLNIPCEEYRQPFPAVAIELPSDYRRIVPAISAAPHQPVFVVALHLGRIVIVASYFDSFTTMTQVVRLNEGILEVAHVRSSFKEHDRTTPEERELSSRLTKMALNVCLFAGTYGAKSLGPANPSHYNRLQRRAKEGKYREAARTEAAMMPFVYGFEQNVTIFKQESSGSLGKEREGGWTVTPHWRRGHWKMQPHGVGMSLRKRIHIPSVLVNAHLFKGDKADTKSIYEG